MPKTIWKYEILVGAPVVIEMSPWNARPIHGGFDTQGRVCLWFEVKPEMVSIKRTFQVFGTGQPIPDGWDHRWSFIDGPFVWHIYEEM
jgi:hypothetical protein